MKLLEANPNLNLVKQVDWIYSSFKSSLIISIQFQNWIGLIEVLTDRVRITVRCDIGT